jgi:hypothetical protein
MPQKSPWRRVAITVSAMLVVLLAVTSVRFLISRGAFAAAPEKTRACRTVPGIGVVADIASDGTNAYIAADGLYVYGRGRLQRLAGTPKDFHPAALAIGEPGQLQVVFRQGQIWDISVFAFAEPLAVKELGRLSADTLTDPADLAALTAGRFYVVNRHAGRTALGRWLDDAFLLPRAEILYFDGMKFVAVVGRLNAPSGLAVSPDGAHLYVSQELPRSLASFSRSEFTGALDHAALFDLPAAPTRLTVAPDGSLIVAAWPKPGMGAVYRVTVAAGVPDRAELLYAGKAPVAAAAELGGRLLIAAGGHLLDCAL